VNNQTQYVEKLSAQLVEWDNQIDRLRNKVESSTTEASADYSRAIADLQLKRDEAAFKLQSISVADFDQWEELKAGTQQVWGEVSTILRDTIMKIK
jgi:uncharacterized coiled-coil protein SlyX